MPRVFHVLALLVPIVAIILVCRTFDVAAKLTLSFPFASHPDTPGDAAQVYISPDYDESGSFNKAAPVDKGVKESEGVNAKAAYSRRIVAVGDLHGDLPHALQTLQMAGVVDKAGHWSGNVDYFVQTGDIIDR